MQPASFDAALSPSSPSSDRNLDNHFGVPGFLGSWVPRFECGSTARTSEPRNLGTPEPRNLGTSKNWPDLPFRIRVVQAENAHEIAALQIARRVAEVRLIRDIGRFEAGLDATPSAQGERAEDREVEVPAARAAELIRPRVPEANAVGLRPRARIEVVAGRADGAGLPTVRRITPRSYVD